MSAAVRPAPTAPLTNAMSVDVEDYFQVHALEPHFPRASWDRVPSRVGASIDRTLELFARHDVRATFFILGWVAERFPDHVRRIAAAGHEIASHGLAHHRVTEFDAEGFRRDLAAARKILEQVSGQHVRGYRAPSYSVGAANRWALDVLEEEGYAYSSSIYPIRHDHYGMREAPRHAFHPTANGRLLEVPITTVEWVGRRMPCGGGGYFRLYPYAVSRWALRQVNEREHRPAAFYFHPWELDPGQPRVREAGMKTRFRHYLNLERMESRLDRLLGDFRWDRMDRVFLGEAKGSGT